MNLLYDASLNCHATTYDYRHMYMHWEVLYEQHEEQTLTPTPWTFLLATDILNNTHTYINADTTQLFYKYNRSSKTVFSHSEISSSSPLLYIYTNRLSTWNALLEKQCLSLSNQKLSPSRLHTPLWCQKWLMCYIVLEMTNQPATAVHSCISITCLLFHVHNTRKKARWIQGAEKWKKVGKAWAQTRYSWTPEGVSQLIWAIATYYTQLHSKCTRSLCSLGTRSPPLFKVYVW